MLFLPLNNRDNTIFKHKVTCETQNQNVKTIETKKKSPEEDKYGQ